MDSQNNCFKTTDTSLAAYLIFEGFNLIRIDYDGVMRGTFIFTSSKRLDKLVGDFSKGTAKGNIVLFDHTRAKLVDRVKRGY